MRQPTDFLNPANAAYIDELYRKFLKDPSSVEPAWATFFAGFELGSARAPKGSGGKPDSAGPGSKGVWGLVNAYRSYGHSVAGLDPLGSRRDSHPFLALEQFGLTQADLDKPLGAGGFKGPAGATLRDLIGALQRTYCGSVAVEYSDVESLDEREWLQERIETSAGGPAAEPAERRWILDRLVAAEAFEAFLQTKYLGQKRFSAEGGEAMVPMLEVLVDTGAGLGAQEMIFGMSHRGRLNTLVHVLDMPYGDIFAEFEGFKAPSDAFPGDGDVKYHLGFSNDVTTRGGKKVHLSLSPNPSHLELINPINEGIVRAKQDHLKDGERTRVVPVLLHGDAAFVGQGIVPETILLTTLPGYEVGGTVHIVVNNQLGFTATPKETRPGQHPTDYAKLVSAPVFHVNGDDPEACLRVARLAMEFRQRFRKDVFVDFVCFRRYGHNETDDPTFTSPLLYKKVAAHPGIAALYAQRLQAEGVVSASDVEAIKAKVKERLDGALSRIRQDKRGHGPAAFGGLWSGLGRAGTDWTARTAVDAGTLARLGDATAKLPAGFNLHRKLKGLVDGRHEMFLGKRPFDWGGAEMAAFASLLAEGHGVRLTGQDVQRGTFSHRHAIFRDTETGAPYAPLQHVGGAQGDFTVLNTMLSELAVMGFECGISWADPRRLVLWEAQFGDFVNGAQAIVDQFISASESKWNRMSGLVLLLPHGQEGMGPEHSSARLERFLQLCGEGNMQVAYLSTPAQYFHALRRQLHRKFRKPLVLMTPKSLLRDERVVSPIEELTQGSFHGVLDDAAVKDPGAVKKVAFTCGKFYWMLQKARAERGAGDVALVRIEQLYPFPAEEVRAALARYPKATEVVWAQEEPRNMGAWPFLLPRLQEVLGDRARIGYFGRAEAASPATGYSKAFQADEAALVARFFTGANGNGSGAHAKPAAGEAEAKAGPGSTAAKPEAPKKERRPGAR